MKKAIAILFTNVILSICAQTPGIKWGTASDISLSKDTKFLGSSSNALYIVDKEGNINNITSLTTDWEKTKKPEPIKINDHKPQSQEYFCIDDKLICISKYFDKAQDAWLVYGTKLTRECTLEKENRLLGILKNTYKIYEKAIQCFVSEDNGKLLIVGEATAGKQVSYFLKIVDSDLNIIHERNFELPYSSETTLLSDFTLDKNGNASFIARINKTKQQKEKGSPYYYNELVVYNSKTGKRVEIPFDFKNYYFDFKIRTDLNGNLVCGALSSDEYPFDEKIINLWKTHQANRVCYLKVDKNDLTLLAQDTASLPRLMLNDKENWGVYLDELNFLRDSSISFICEHRYTGPPGPYPNYDFHQRAIPAEHTDQLLIMSTKPGSKTLAIKKLVKRQVADFNPKRGIKNTYGFCSYLLLKSDTKVAAIFNRDKEEADAKENKPEGTTLFHSFTHLEQPVTFMWNIESGQELRLMKDGDPMILCRYGKPLNNNEYLIVARQNMKYIFGILSYK